MGELAILLAAALFALIIGVELFRRGIWLLTTSQEEIDLLRRDAERKEFLTAPLRQLAGRTALEKKGE